MQQPNFSRASVAAALCVLSGLARAASCHAAGFSCGVAAGDVTDAAAVLWTRADEPGEVALELAGDPAFASVLRTAAAQACEDRDLTVKIDADGLQPATTYYYRFTRLDDPAAQSRIGSFRTAPAPDSPGEFTFTFSGDSNAPFEPFYVLETMVQDRPDFFIYGGDTIYADMSGPIANELGQYRVKYQEVFADRYLQDVFASTAVWAMWDDHEVVNNYSGASDPLVADYVYEAYAAFFEYLPIRPMAGFRTYRGLRYGSLAEFFFLDNRQYRSPSAQEACNGALDPEDFLIGPYDPACVDALNNPTRTMLGPEQLAWLLAGLKNSTARWKFIISSVPMVTFGLLPYDGWQGYQAERMTILKFLAEQNIANVVIIAADSHLNAYAPDVTHYIKQSRPGELPDDFILPEFIAGPIATDTFKRAIVGYAPELIGLPSDWLPVRLAMNETFRRAMRRFQTINDLAFLSPNRFAYLLARVRADHVEFEFKGIRPNTDEPTPARTLYQTTLPPPQPTGSPPCALLAAFPALGVPLLARRFVTIRR